MANYKNTMENIYNLKFFIKEGELIVKIPRRIAKNSLNKSDLLLDIKKNISQDIVINVIKEGIVDGGKFTNIDNLINTTIAVILDLGNDFTNRNIKNYKEYKCNIERLGIKYTESNLIEFLSIKVKNSDFEKYITYDLKSVKDKTLVWFLVCMFREFSDEIIDSIKEDIMKIFNNKDLDINEIKRYIINSDNNEIIQLEKHLDSAATIVGELKNYIPNRNVGYKLFNNGDIDKVSAYLCKSTINSMYFIIWYSLALDDIIRETELLNSEDMVMHIKEHCNKNITYELESFEEFMSVIMKELDESFSINIGYSSNDLEIMVKDDDEEVYSYNVYVNNKLVLKNTPVLMTLDKEYLENVLIKSFKAV